MTTIATANKAIGWWPALTAMLKLPENVCRMIIDTGYPDDIVKVYYECHADERMMEILSGLLVGAVTIRAKDMPQKDAERKEPSGDGIPDRD
ncbi:MAG: hypothetical protein ACYTEX_22155 [Planctomycetota bacterium]